MFDLQDKESTRVIPARNDEGDPGTSEPITVAHELDSEDMVELHARMLSHYRTELDRQESNRAAMATDEDYYDNKQWTDEEEAELRERGQSPTVYNVISQSINWILGSEKRGRSDFKVLPRRKADGKAAERKTSLLKYLSDCNHTPYERSRAFEDAVKAGIGWLEAQYQDEDDGEPLYAGAESWRNILFDSTYRRLDMEDCRYIFRVKWVDEDIALAMFPDRRGTIEASATDGFDSMGTDDDDGDYAMDSRELENSLAGGNRQSLGHSRRRVRLIEAWFRVPVQVPKLKGRSSDFRGEAYDPNDERHQLEIETGRAQVATGPMMRMHCAIMTTTGLLYVSQSPYRHNRFPFTPIWGYRRASDGLPYGVIRFMRGMQDDVNKRMSKALYILSSNKVVMDEGAVEDIEEFRQEYARPDSVTVKKRGYELKTDVDRDLAPAHLELASRSIQMIQQVGGVTDELLGRSTNAVSGVAIEARQEQGSVGTSGLFDNLRLGFQQHGEKELSLVEQFMTEEKQFRITNARGNPEYMAVNDGLPENDITRTKADFIVDEVDWRATMRQAAVAELMELATKLPPEVVMTMLDLLVESMDVPNREEIVKRIRAINGQKDPDQTEPTPEDIAKEQAAQEQAEYNKQLALATLREQVAKAAKAEAEAAVAIANAKKTDVQTIREGVGAMKEATDAATAVAFMPELAPLADSILQEAGWASANLPAPGAPVDNAGMVPGTQQPIQAQPVPPQGPTGIGQPPAGM